MTRILRHRLGQFFAVLLLAFVFFQWGIPLLSRLVTGRPAPVPAHLLWTIYMPTVIFVLLLYISADEASWAEFRRPVTALIVEQQRASLIWLRRALLAGLPLLGGVLTYVQVRTEVRAPPELRSVHPAPPSAVTIDGETISLRSATNPYRNPDGSPDPAALQEGMAVYGQNCVVCHGDALAGDGLFADRLRPRPADFTDSGTIAQLQESYLFWRIATGGPGLPPEGKGWNSAMPAWAGTLSADQIWQVILYLYDATGQHPRTGEE